MIHYDPNKTALILVDPFNDFLSEGGKLYDRCKETLEGTGVVNNLKQLLGKAREKGIQVIYAPHHHTIKSDFLNWEFMTPSHAGSKNLVLFEKGSWGGDFHPDLVMQDGDILAQNHWTGSGFANTDLDFLLRKNGIEYIVIAGMRANTCIDSTARFGVELGYHVTLISDAIGAFNYEEIKATAETNFPHYGHAVFTTAAFIHEIQ